MRASFAAFSPWLSLCTCLIYLSPSPPFSLRVPRAFSFLVFALSLLPRVFFFFRSVFVTDFSFLELVLLACFFLFLSRFLFLPSPLRVFFFFCVPVPVRVCTFVHVRVFPSPFFSVRDSLCFVLLLAVCFALSLGQLAVLTI